MPTMIKNAINLVKPAASNGKPAPKPTAIERQVKRVAELEQLAQQAAASANATHGALLEAKRVLSEMQADAVS
jgi:hypothetical protein